MITWTMHGTWLQGDKRGYVKDGKVLTANKGLESANKVSQKSETVRLGPKHKKIVENTILTESERIGQKIFALSVFSNHVHLVMGIEAESIESAVSRYKNVATRELKKSGLSGKMWTRGFNKIFCFTQQQLDAKIQYVRNHTTND